MAMKDINDTKQWEQFCEKLIQKTQAQNLEWEDWSDHIGRPDSRSPLFVATYKDWHILIYKFAYKYFHDEEQYDWEQDVTIELIKQDGKTDWTLPKVPSRHALLDLVQFQNANVESLLDDILED